ncbi:MAG: hypothetical protein A2Y34_08920 [Spirochaetes bacterium GWC1_27_15]|nr:MAG: hypothetical protein A2Z98_17265 [Spirochaetes bacterium GWB1_27_13]OHD27743.1 MAG: hypothetical protein A2Y34_08920 [Spirochaetes bacterium GWC1_27_15]
MGILDKIYLSSYESKNNATLIFFSFICLLIIAVFVIFALSIKYKEVIIEKGYIYPSITKELSIIYDSYIEVNNIVIGEKYKKGDKILIFNKDTAKNNLIKYENELNYKQNIKNITSNYISIIENKKIDFEIADLLLKIKLLKNEVRDDSLEIPFDCILISSNYEKIDKGYIERGTILCKIISIVDPILKIEIKDKYINRIKAGQLTKIYLKNEQNNLDRTINRLEILELDKKITNYAIIKLDTKYIQFIGMEAKVNIISNNMSLSDLFIRSFK